MLLQIKIAYYDLSKRYHPDQYKGEEDAACIFREITEAYEVLGNLQKRRMYDKGVHNFEAAVSPAEAEEYAAKFYESRGKRTRMPYASGRTPIYDFDEWSRSHYEANFVRHKEAKERYEFKKNQEERVVEAKKRGAIVWLVVLSTMAIFYESTVSSSHDIPEKSNSK